MLSLSKVFKDQQKYGVAKAFTDSENVSYDSYLAGCRRLMTDKTPAEYYDWDIQRQNEFNESLIVNYVKENKKAVDGYVDENGDLEQEELINRLKTDIVDFGILREALEDDTIQEIQINDCKTIWVIRGGRAELFVDKNGKPYQFASDEELHSTIDRLIFSPKSQAPRMTKMNPLLNARTAGKGYRLSAVNSTAITPDSTIGYDFPCTSVTIRKYAPSMLTFKDFEKFGTLTPEMSKLLRMLGKANIRLACVGPTSSGKTTLLNAIAWEVDPELRLLLIQNPTEIMIYRRNPDNGANTRNALHWEAQDLNPEAGKDPTTPTMANMISHTLRNTPDVIVPGEIRTPEEFFQANRALKTGHRILTTWHALDGADAIDRASTELSTLGGSASEHARSLASAFDIVVSQQKLGDGSRHVMAIEELTGRIVDGRAETKKLFEYVLTGESDKDPVTGKVTKIYGYFQQVHPLSDKLVQSFYQVGITKEEIAEFVTVPPIKKGETNIPSQVGLFQRPKKVEVKEEKKEEDTLSFLKS